MATQSAFLCLLSAAAVAGLQFDLPSWKTKCIGEIMTKHEVAKGRYAVVGAAEGTQTAISLQVTGPGGETEHSANDIVSGSFGFTAGDAGAHKVCFASRSGQQYRIDFDFASGVAAKDYTDIATKEHLKPLELELRKIEDRVDGVLNEMMYQREREEAHRNTNESTNARVVGYSFLTMGVVAIVSVTQAVYLYNYLKRKRIVQP